MTCYGFLAEWFDPQAKLTREYILKYFVKEHMLEMVDKKLNRAFLKKSPAPSTINEASFYIGATVVIHSRALKIVDYQDKTTASLLGPKLQASCLVITPDAMHNAGKILAEVCDAGYRFTKLKTLALQQGAADELSELLEGQVSPGVLGSGVCIAAEVSDKDAPGRLATLGQDLAAKYGSGASPGVCVANGTSSHAAALAEFCFDRPFPSTATLSDCTCCVVLPHAVAAGHTGAVLDEILESGYEVSAAQLFHLTPTDAHEFLEVYQGVVPEYNDMALGLCTGPCLALEVRAQNAVETFRETAGPWDVEMARALRPKTLRAKFGVDRVRNAVHCTDLGSDGGLECEFFFSTLQR